MRPCVRHSLDCVTPAGHKTTTTRGLRMFRVIAGLALSVVLAAAPLSAQTTVAVSGAVKDASGAVLPGAAVNVVVAERTVAATTTGGDGRYQLQVPAGVPLQLRVHLEGFADQAIEMSGVERPVTR